MKNILNTYNEEKSLTKLTVILFAILTVILFIVAIVANWNGVSLQTEIFTMVGAGNIAAIAKYITRNIMGKKNDKKN